jgi:hypothetical protein
MRKPNSLFDRLAQFVNSKEVGATYTSEEMQDVIGEYCPNSILGRYYRLNSYQCYLSYAGITENVSRGVHKICMHVPDWLTIGHLQFFHGHGKSGTYAYAGMSHNAIRIQLNVDKAQHPKQMVNKPEPKFKIGDTVRLIETYTGKGLIVNDELEGNTKDIKGLAGNIQTIKKIEWNTKTNEWFYYCNAFLWCAEHGLELILRFEIINEQKTNKNQIKTMSNKIMVIGTRNLKEAFVKEIESQGIAKPYDGYEGHPGIEQDTHGIIPHHDTAELGWALLDSDSYKDDTKFNLPKDWDAAIKAVKEKYAAKPIMIAGYTAEVEGKGIKFGCQHITLEEIKAMKHMVSDPINMKASIGTTIVNITLLEQLEKMINK